MMHVWILLLWFMPESLFDGDACRYKCQPEVIVDDCT